MKKIVLSIKTDYSKIPDKFHLDAQIRFPSKTFKNRKKYDRKARRSVWKKQSDFN